MIAVPTLTITHMFVVITTAISIALTLHITVVVTFARGDMFFRPMFNTITTILPTVQMAMTTSLSNAVTTATAATPFSTLCMV